MYAGLYIISVCIQWDYSKDSSLQSVFIDGVYILSWFEAKGDKTALICSLRVTIWTYQFLLLSSLVIYLSPLCHNFCHSFPLRHNSFVIPLYITHY